MNQEELNERLLNACREGNLELVKKLVNDGADIHYTNIGTCTPFEIASTYGHLSIVKWLYEKGADPTIDNNYAIRIASRNGHLEVVKYLYSIGCDPTDVDNCAIQWASRNGHLEVVKYLYTFGCDPTADDNNAIKCACIHGHLEVIKWLYYHGADPTVNDNYAIRYASEYGHLEVVKFLALVGCDTSRIINLEMRKEVIEYLNKYKHVFNKCLSEIYGHPGLERTKTENEIYFREYLNQ